MAAPAAGCASKNDEDLGEVRRSGEEIGVAQHDELARCLADTAIHRPGESRLPSHLDQSDSGVVAHGLRVAAPTSCDGSLLRTTISSSSGGLLEEHGHRLAKEVGVLVRRNQDAHAGATVGRGAERDDPPVRPTAWACSQNDLPSVEGLRVAVRSIRLHAANPEDAQEEILGEPPSIPLGLEVREQVLDLPLDERLVEVDEDVRGRPGRRRTWEPRTRG